MDWHKHDSARWRAKCRRLDPFVEGCFKRLVDDYMISRKRWPDDDAELAAICVIPVGEFLDKVKPVLFAPTARGKPYNHFGIWKEGHFWLQTTCEENLAEQRELSEFGRKGVAARKAKDPNYGKAKNQVKSTQEHSPPNAPPNAGANAEREREREKEGEGVSIPTFTETPLLTPPGFKIFWDMFPPQNRGNKIKASAAYCSALTRTTEGEIHEGLKRYAASDEVARGKISRVDNWLNNDKWASDYRSAKNSPGTPGHGSEKANRSYQRQGPPSVVAATLRAQAKRKASEDPGV